MQKLQIHSSKLLWSSYKLHICEHAPANPDYGAQRYDWISKISKSLQCASSFKKSHARFTISYRTHLSGNIVIFSRTRMISVQQTTTARPHHVNVMAVELLFPVSALRISPSANGCRAAAAAWELVWFQCCCQCHRQADPISCLQAMKIFMCVK